MQMFGLLALLITMMLGAWLLIGGTGTTSTNTSTEEQEAYGNYFDAIDAAEKAAEAMGGDVVGSQGGSVVVYDGIGVSQGETNLNLSNRGLEGSLKAEVRQLSKLRVLDISNNNFTGLPAEVGQLSELEVLNLSYNPLTGLPYELGNLQNLKMLDLRGMNYAKADLEVIKNSLPESVNILVD